MMLGRPWKGIGLALLILAFFVTVAGAQEAVKSDRVDIATEDKKVDTDLSAKISNTGKGEKRYDIQPITLGTVGLAILIDHQTGTTWVLTPIGNSFVSGNFKWTIIPFPETPHAP